MVCEGVCVYMRDVGREGGRSDVASRCKYMSWKVR